MIRMEVIKNVGEKKHGYRDEEGHFVVFADEPMRIEISGKDIICHVYEGVEVDLEQPPAGAFLSDNKQNLGWLKE